jgi:hypothetical protein
MISARSALLTAVLAASAAIGGPAQAADKPACDRGCLEKLVVAYLKALPTHDPSTLAGSRGARFVENDQPLKLGEGTWATVTGLGKYRHIFADPEMGKAAVITTVQENGVPAILDVVLTTQKGRITEVESQIIRDAKGAQRYEALGVPAPEWLEAVPPAQRIPREALAATANKYFQGMKRDDPKGDYSFFDPDCNRLEHAEQTTNLKVRQAYGHSSDTDFSSMTCQQQFQTGFLGFVTDMRDRRFEVVDEERQEVFAFVNLDHNGTVRVLHMSTGKDFVIPAYFDVPRTLQAGEAFRMRGDKIWRIEMTLTELPYGTRPAQDAPPPAPRARDLAAKPPCDRTCLGGYVDQVLQAMMDHDPSHAPLAPNVRYTENGQALAPGDGLWGTATAIAVEGDGLSSLGPNSSAYRLYFADPAMGEAGYLGAVNENGTPGILALRVKVSNQKVTEIEAVVVRQEGTGPRGGTMTLMRPLLLAEMNVKGFTGPDPSLLSGGERWTRTAMANTASHYFDGMLRSSSIGIPLGEDCVRRDNGGQTTGNSAAAPLDPAVPAFKPFALGCAAQLDSGFFHYVSAVRDRHALVVDEDRGLVLEIAMVDHTGAVKTIPTPAGQVSLPSNLLTPSTDMMVAVFKMSNGRIERIEALDRAVPYGMTTGWTE